MYSIFEQLLQKNGVTAYKVSKETGIAQSVFSAWKNGTSSPKKDKLQKIADYFNVSVDYIVTGQEHSTDYYLTDETLDIALEIANNKELKMLFDASRTASAERLMAYYNLIKAMQDTEKGKE